MKLIKTAFLMMFFSVLVVITIALAAEDKKPTVPAETQAKILKLELRQQVLNGQYSQCQTIVSQIPSEFNKNQEEIKRIVEEATKKAGLDPKDWDLNLETFEFVKKSQPSSPAPAK